ncbi:MAG: hypothetical protein KDJ65_13365 [Anaerolineae bacterium]|nr:hypothetical protein [Anaerolineae bacterium]
MNRWALLLSTLFAFYEKRFSGTPRFVTLFVLALGISLLLSPGAWAETLFQSPASPVIQEAEPVQNEPFAPSEEPFSPVAEPEDSFDPSQSQETFDGEVPVDIIEEPLGEPALEDEDPLNLDSASPAEDEPPVEELRPVRLERDDEEGSRNFILDQAELIDTVVVSTAYIWLCCGIGLFLLIPLVFLFLQIRGRHKIIKEEIY